MLQLQDLYSKKSIENEEKRQLNIEKLNLLQSEKVDSIQDKAVKKFHSIVSKINKVKIV